ncbi:hypothetical protein HYT56_02485 [Candidatus Woesearchaeota archaeon]|nr:hypothetical protein [Candidatus Woesearchaeota archaeon]
MAKKRSRKVSEQRMLPAHTDKLLIATISLLSALLILNLVTLTGFSTKFKTDYGATYATDNTCQRIGGIIFREGVSANFNGKKVTLLSTSEDAVGVDVNGENRGILSGHDNYIDGVMVTNFLSTENDACLILK